MKSKQLLLLFCILLGILSFPQIFAQTNISNVMNGGIRDCLVWDFPAAGSQLDNITVINGTSVGAVSKATSVSSITFNGNGGLDLAGSNIVNLGAITISNGCNERAIAGTTMFSDGCYSGRVYFGNDGYLDRTINISFTLMNWVYKDIVIKILIGTNNIYDWGGLDKFTVEVEPQMDGKNYFSTSPASFSGFNNAGTIRYPAMAVMPKSDVVVTTTNCGFSGYGCASIISPPGLCNVISNASWAVKTIRFEGDIEYMKPVTLKVRIFNSKMKGRAPDFAGRPQSSEVDASEFQYFVVYDVLEREM